MTRRRSHRARCARALVATLALSAGCVRAPAPAAEPAPEQPVEAPPAAATEASTAPTVTALPARVPAPASRQPYDPLASVRSPTDLTLVPLQRVDAVAAGIARPGGTRGTLHLTIDGCRIVEPEPLAPTASSDAATCRRSVREDFDGRGQRVLVVPAGSWEIVVDNARAERDGGLWLRDARAPERTLVSAGGIAAGGTARYEVELTPGQWIYSCPVTPTPDYLLVVP